MNTVSLGVRNAFRNVTRSLSIVIILGLSIGLSLVMLIAHQAVIQKINQVKSSIGNTITIAPAGYSSFSEANNALTTSQLSNIKNIPNVTNVTEQLTDRLTTIGAASFPTSFGQNSKKTTATNTTSLTSPVKLNMPMKNSNGSTSSIHVFVNGGGSLPSNFSLPITVIGTTDPTSLNGTTVSITSGKDINGSKDTNDALISTAMASKNNLKVGSTFKAYNTKLTVTGLFKSGTEIGDGDLVLALPTVQRLSDQAGAVTSATVTVNSLDNLSTATTAVKSELGTSADVTSAQDQANDTVQPLNSVASVSLYSLIGAAIAGSIIVLLTMIMIVRERRREIGILKAIGASNIRIIFQFMSEALTFTLLAAVIGLIIGIVGANPVTNLLVTNSSNSSTATSSTSGFAGGSPGGGLGGFRGGNGGGAFISRNFGAQSLRSSVRNLHANVGWTILLYGIGAAFLIAIIGSSFAGWLIARVRPSEVMRAE